MKRWRHRSIGAFPRLAVVVVLSTFASIVGFASGATAAAKASPGVTSSTITIGLITSETGAAASSFSDDAGGALARFALQNAQGGVDGRKLKLVVEDDQSSPTVCATAAHLLASKGVFGVISASAITADTECASNVLSPLGIPVTNWEVDTTHSNTFSSLYPNIPTAAQVGGLTYYYDYEGPFLKKLGVTKLASLGPGPGTTGLQTIVDGVKHDGISNCYENGSTLGSVDFTVQALAIKNLGCNGSFMLQIDASDIGYAAALRNAGVNIKELYETGYDESVLSSKTATAALNGAYIANQVNLTNPNAPTKVMLNAIKKYDTQYTGGLPDFGTWSTYLSADLMIKGLELAGQTPTRSGFISKLHQVTAYSAGGIEPNSWNFTHFGTIAALPKTDCWYYLQLKNGKYVTANGGKPVCGKLYSVRL